MSKSALLVALLAACGGGGGGAGTDGSTPTDGTAPHDSPVQPDTGSGGSGSGSNPSSPAHWVLGYYVGYEINTYPIAEIDWSALSEIAFSPMVVKSDLSLDTTFDDTNGTGPADAKLLSAAAHSHGVRALLMLGGANAGGNIATAASAAHRAAFVTTLLATLDDLGFDGIDLDWEDSVNLDDLVSLAQALRAARPSIVLTYPAYTINSNYETVDARMVTLAAALDQFNVQTYSPDTTDVGQGWDSWFVSPLSGEAATTPITIDDTLGRYATAGIPKAKLGMGTVFYAICYTGGITGPRQATTVSTAIIGGDNAYPSSAFFASGGTYDTHSSAIVRDATAHQPYLTFAQPIADSHCGGSTQYISYEDEQSLADKGAFAKANGYGGIIMWQLAEGYLPANAAGGRSRTALFDAIGSAFLH